MKQKFHIEIVLLGIVSIISLASFLGAHSFEAAATINSINGDTNSSQYIVREAGNTTVTNSTAHVKIGIGTNVIVKNKSENYTSGAKQTFGPSTTSAGINLGVLTNNPTSVKQGDLWYQSTLNVLGYGGTSGTPLQLVTTGGITQTISNKKFFDSTTSFTTVADPTKLLLFSVANILTGHSDTWTFPNANSTFVGTNLTQTITGTTTMNSLIATLAGNLNLGNNLFNTNGHIITPPQNTGTILLTNGSLSSLTGNLNSVGGTFTGTDSGTTMTGTISGTPTFSGSPVTINNLKLGGQMDLNGNTMKSSGHVYTFPSNTGTVLLTNGTLTGTVSGATLSGTLAGTPTYSGTQTYSSNISIAGNVTSTAAKEFKISAPAGIPICIGTGC